MGRVPGRHWVGFQSANIVRSAPIIPAIAMLAWVSPVVLRCRTIGAAPPYCVVSSPSRSVLTIITRARRAAGSCNAARASDANPEGRVDVRPLRAYRRPEAQMTLRSSFVSTILLLPALALIAACGGPKVDASTDEACLSSLQNVSQHAARGSDSAAYARVLLTAVGQLAFAGLGEAFAGMGNLFDDQAPSVKMPARDSLLFQRALCDAVNGMTAEQIIANADSVAPRVKGAYDRRYATLQIQALQDARQRYQAVAESLARFKVVSARLLQERGFLGLEATIVLSVENKTAHPLSRAYFHGRVVSPGRSVPWIEGDFNYSIPGGLEPGERATWRLSPNMFTGKWTSVRAPSDSKMEVRTVKLAGPDGEPLWGGSTFTTGDQKLLDSLVARFGR